MKGGLILAAPASGCGKTTITLALLYQLRKMGHKVASAKIGPDYIDPTFHRAASGGPCLNLDSWAMRPETLGALASSLEAQADLILCEGMMGLFDGAGVDGDAGSTADVAARLGWPVVLIVDVGAQGASAAATVLGFAKYRPDIHLAGVIFNRVGGIRHAAMLSTAMAAMGLDIDVLGHVPTYPDIALPERHLGLVPAEEHQALDKLFARAGQLIGGNVDLGRLPNMARPGRHPPARSTPLVLKPLGQRIAVARDNAFAFAYPATLDGWRAAGAEIVPFSPLADEPPDPTADAIFLPGGYPELHAGTLAAASRTLEGLRRAASRRAVLYGECGGYMLLGAGLTDGKGERHAMAGLLPVETSFAAPRLHLGYRSVSLMRDGPLGRAGEVFRGHEFHFASTTSEDEGDALFQVDNSDGISLGPTGLMDGSVMGSFIHLVDRA